MNSQLVHSLIGAILGFAVMHVIFYIQRRKRMHAHRCQCGYRWRHGDDKAGDVAAHTCKKCGREEWWRCD